MWNELQTNIGSISALLSDGYEIEVDSPDGWVAIDQYVDKGLWDEYILTVDTGLTVRCNENHLFETGRGWMSAKDMANCETPECVLTADGHYKSAVVVKTNRQIPIVDITVKHDNHRYYTNGVSSHNTGVGKSLTMCHFAAANLSLGKNVLYITLEMSETEIAKRIDANLMDVEIAALEMMCKSEYDRKINKIRADTKGKLIIKEYPTAGAHAGHFRHLINELHLKRNFTPDVIYIDYINICQSSRAKMSAGSVNSYTMIKSIAEELRGLAAEKNVPVVTATQVNRTGFSNVDPSMTDTAESFGLPATCDLLLALVSSDELAENNHIMVKQLKSRYNDINKDRRFVVGINRAKMRLYDVPNATAAFTMDHDADKKDIPLFDKTDMGRRMEEESRPAWGKPKKRDFSHFKTED